MGRMFVTLCWGLLFAAPAAGHGLQLSAESAWHTSSGHAEIHGLLRYADGLPMSQARVVLHQTTEASGEWPAKPAPEGLSARQVSSDTAGQFRFMAVPQGQYQLVAEDGIGHRTALNLIIEPSASQQAWTSPAVWGWRELAWGLVVLLALFALAVSVARAVKRRQAQA